MRNLLLFLHVLAAIVLIGPTTLATSVFARHAAAADLPAARGAHRTSRAYGTASVVVPAVGLVLAFRIEVLSALWVELAVLLFGAGAGVLLGLHLPAQRAAVAALEAGGTVAGAVVARLRWTAGVYSLGWTAILWLMIAKPR